MAERVVLCMKWGTLYSAKYVNILHRAVKDHLSYPFRFVCLTDDADGLDPEIEHHPIPDLGLPEEKVYHGAWPKLSVFGVRLYDLTGRCLFIDLDSVIVGSLDPFFDVDATFHAIGGGVDWRRGAEQVKPPTTCNNQDHALVLLQLCGGVRLSGCDLDPFSLFGRLS